jgi:peptidoglycan/xylan/chitin deacetylase (PgdA/CDA1 family)
MQITAITLGFHDVLDEKLGPVAWTPSMRYKLDAAVFARHLAAIDRVRTKISLTVIDHLRHWEGHTPVFLTFDDGALSSYTLVAPALEQYRWRGHFFVTTDWIGREGFLDRRQIRELHRAGHVIGSHTCSHPERMSALSWDQLMREWSVSIAILSDLVGERVRVASVAAGYYSSKVAKAAAAAGIEVLFTSEPRTTCWTVGGCLVLGRYSIQRHTPPANSAALVTGRLAPRWRQWVQWELRKLPKSIAGEAYLPLRRFLLSRGS